MGIPPSKLRITIDTAIQQIWTQVKSGDNVRINIPPLGALIIKDKKLGAVFNKSQKKSESHLTNSQDGPRWLKSQLDIDTARMSSPPIRASTSYSYRPPSTQSRGAISVNSSRTSKSFGRPSFRLKDELVR